MMIRNRPNHLVAAILAVTVFSNTMLTLETYAQTKTLGKLERLTAEFDKLVDPAAKAEIVAEGFTWTEGPVWIGGKDGHLLFSDIPRNTIFKYQPGVKGQAAVSVFMTPSGYTGVTYYGLEPGSNGLFLDKQGRLCMCEHGDRRVSALTPGGGKITLADRFEGKRFNSPNDGVVSKSGDIYFTDPPYGLPQRAEDPLRELDFCGVYRLKSSGELALLTKAIARPNGIALSPDEKTLYVAQSDPKQANWTRFEIKSDGTLAEGKEFHNATERVGKEPGLPDGLEVDSQGNIWASGPGGIFVFNSNTELIGRIVTGERTSNCTLTPEGWLYMTVDSYLCRIKTSSSPIIHSK
jgi:gluconolactonase